LRGRRTVAGRVYCAWAQNRIVEMNQDLSIFITPAALIISCALIAAGGLYFINIKYCKSPLQAVASLVAGFAILGVLEIVLAGSSVAFFKAQQVQTSACELEGEAAHPEERTASANPKTRGHIVACMNDFGYEWTTEHRHCREAAVPTNPFCYLPTQAFDRAVTSFQLQFE
jgi:hypothetical protein